LKALPTLELRAERASATMRWSVVGDISHRYDAEMWRVVGRLLLAYLIACYVVMVPMVIWDLGGNLSQMFMALAMVPVIIPLYVYRQARYAFGFHVDHEAVGILLAVAAVFGVIFWWITRRAAQKLANARGFEVTQNSSIP
jgi:hypothetical protein